MLKAVELTKNYNGNIAFDALNLSIEEGDVYCLPDANGAGKTTTINLFLNFLQPDAGRALINGLDAAENSLVTKKYLAYIPESEYRTDDTTVATKIPTRLLDTPQAITSISPQVIADRLATEVNDIYKNVAGLNQTTYSAVVFRGFTQRETLFNGVRGNPYGSLEGDVNNAGFSTSILRLLNVERVEVLKGPAAVLYGSADPGGIINFITKKPKTVLDGTAEMRFGAYGLAMGNADFSLPLSKKLSTRCAGFLERRDSFRRNAGLKNQNCVANLLWQPDDRTRVSFEYEFIRQNPRGHRHRGVPVDANGRFTTGITFTTTERTDFVKLDANVLPGKVTRDVFADGLVEAIFRYLTIDRFENYHEPRGLLAEGRTMRRGFRYQLRKNKDWSLTFNAYKPFSAGNFGVHTLNAGGEYYTQDHEFRFVTVSAGVPLMEVIFSHRKFGKRLKQSTVGLRDP